MAIAQEIKTNSEMKLRAGIGLASMFVVGCFCAAIVMSGTQTQAAENATIANAPLAQHSAAQ